MTLTLVVRDPAFATVDLDAIGMTFPSVTVNGDARMTWTSAAGKLNVPVCEGPSCPPHAPGDTLVVAVTYSCNPTTGFYYYPRNRYTLSEPSDAPYWWPCYDEPSDKTTLDVYATVPLTESCWSNGLLIGIAPGGIPTYAWSWQAVPADPPAPDESDVALFVRQVQTAAPLYRMPIEFKVTRAARPDTFVTVWNDAVGEQASAVRVNGTVTGVTIDPRNGILKRVRPYVLDAGDPVVSLDPGPGRIELSATPNPSHGNVVLRGGWLDGAAATMPPSARFAVFDAGGRLLRDLGAIAGATGGGAFAVTWDRRDDAGQVVAPGIYFAQITAGVKREARPIVLVR